MVAMAACSWIQLSVLELLNILIESIFISRDGRAKQHLGDLHERKRKFDEYTIIIVTINSWVQIKNNYLRDKLKFIRFLLMLKYSSDQSGALKVRKFKLALIYIMDKVLSSCSHTLLILLKLMSPSSIRFG